jgi:phytoene/squalene synthetase
MPAVAVRTASSVIPSPRRTADDLPRDATEVSAAAGYQRVLHQFVRRELRILADLATWAPAGEAHRTATLTRHADLIGRVLLHHHAAEREAVWPTLLAAVPPQRASEVRAALDDWTARCARIDHMLRDVATAARQWSVAATAASRNSFAMSCRAVAVAVDAQTADEERVLMPMLATHLRAEDWLAIARSSRCRLTGSEQLLVLGLALEDACATDRERLLGGLSPATRTAWRVSGRRHYRAAVVRLRGAPPAP